MKPLFLLAGILFLLADLASYGEVIRPRIMVLMLSRCHMCHDPFIPRDHLVLVPEADLIRIERKGRFRIFVENTFRVPLRGVRLLVENPAFDIEVEPRTMDLVPGQRASFWIKLKLKEGYELGDFPLRIRVDAREAILRPAIERVGIIVDNEVPLLPLPPEVVPEIEPEVIPPEVLEQEDIVEPPVEEVAEIAVRVEEFILAKHWYLYLIPILLLIGLLVWRRWRQK